jgi:hypothetical protein
MATLRGEKPTFKQQPVDGRYVAICKHPTDSKTLYRSVKLERPSNLEVIAAGQTVASMTGEIEELRPYQIAELFCIMTDRLVMRGTLIEVRPSDDVYLVKLTPAEQSLMPILTAWESAQRQLFTTLEMRIRNGNV